MGDADEIRRILSTKDFYAILGVARDVDEDELRRKYKRLALICHPDKCSHPQAEEAFKAVGKAFTTLSDAQKRAQYDRFGEEGLQNGRSAARQPEPDDIYDIFTQMFGAEFQDVHGRRYVFRSHHGPRRQQQQQAAQSTAQFFQLLPVFLFLLVYVLFGLTGDHDSGSPYSLHIDQSHGYTIKRKTRTHKVPYFVKSSFASEFGRDASRLHYVEEHVFSNYKGYLGRRCQYEQREKAALRQRANAHYADDDDQDTAADGIETPACEELANLISRFGL